MSIFNIFSKVNKNKSKFFSLCEQFVLKYEKNNFGVPSCKDEIMTEIKAEINSSSDVKEFFSDESNDYTLYANILISNMAFNMLTSGKYHLHYGILNPIGISKNLLAVYNGAMEWALENNQITCEEKEKEYELLMEGISQVG